MKILDAHEKLNKINKRIVEKLNLSKLSTDYYISEWMSNCQQMLIQTMCMELFTHVDIYEIKNKTDEEIYEFVYNRLVKNLTSVLDGLNK